MFFTVDPSNGVAIYSQIVRQVKFAVAEQTLRPGQLLPSVRQLSQQLAVNPNTVARAFQDLQSEGVIETLRGRGVVVCKGAVERCRKQRQSLLAERLSAVLTEALQAGLSAKEVRKLVDEQLRTLDGTIEAIAELQ
ncbi:MULTISPECIES: GntR family transcriptional regulator [Rhodopirellula]|jgi:GntR family transcriptional regulator|uniref:GntR family transcriptional regulator n=1 Tax=Rhodopirellula bahusiensis TaxID=2014065 RepID=A0A2G1WBY1_9BACT|nr:MULTISPECIES: GntR family transcriptional regulator [Rhodopirellula]MCR9210983.1 GntR family transcriptional regulator [bacterium]PHQ36542.1 GntR family transcriptional regulator [Rhodopirellula bahusiensis]|tara:strand:- start:47542 stop:47949 length:408 start_codon:yes stop_codon:yes gene_type:complete